MRPGSIQAQWSIVHRGRLRLRLIADSVYHGQRAPHHPQETTRATIRVSSARQPGRVPADPGRARSAGQAGGRGHRPPAPDEERGPAARLWWWTSPASASFGSVQNGDGLRIGAAVTARELELGPACGRPTRRWPRARPWSARSRSGTWPRWAATSATPRRRPTWRRRCWRWTPRPSSPGPGGDRRVPMAVVLPGRPPDRARAGRAAGGDRSCRPPGPGSGGNYLRHTPRRELDIAVVGRGVPAHAVRAARCTKARIALAAVAPTPVRATAAEQALEGQPGHARGRSSGPPALAVEAAAAHQRPARLGRVPPPPGPGPDPPHADHRAPRAARAPRSAEERRTCPSMILSCTVNGEAGRGARPALRHAPGRAARGRWA